MLRTWAKSLPKGYSPPSLKEGVWNFTLFLEVFSVSYISYFVNFKQWTSSTSTTIKKNLSSKSSNSSWSFFYHFFHGLHRVIKYGHRSAKSCGISLTLLCHVKMWQKNWKKGKEKKEESISFDWYDIRPSKQNIFSSDFSIFTTYIENPHFFLDFGHLKYSKKIRNKSKNIFGFFFGWIWKFKKYWKQPEKLYFVISFQIYNL